MRIYRAVACVLALSYSESVIAIAAQLPPGGTVPVTRVIGMGEQVSDELFPATFSVGTGLTPAVHEIAYEPI